MVLNDVILVLTLELLFGSGPLDVEYRVPLDTEYLAPLLWAVTLLKLEQAPRFSLQVQAIYYLVPVVPVQLRYQAIHESQCALLEFLQVCE